MIFSPDGLMIYNNGIFAIVDDMPLLSQWIKKSDKSKLVEFFGGAGVIKNEHPSILLFSPSKAASISSSGILSMLKDFLLALIIKVKWSSYK